MKNKIPVNDFVNSYSLQMKANKIEKFTKFFENREYEQPPIPINNTKSNNSSRYSVSSNKDKEMISNIFNSDIEIANFNSSVTTTPNRMMFNDPIIPPIMPNHDLNVLYKKSIKNTREVPRYSQDYSNRSFELKDNQIDKFSSVKGMPTPEIDKIVDLTINTLKGNNSMSKPRENLISLDSPKKSVEPFDNFNLNKEHNDKTSNSLFNKPTAILTTVSNNTIRNRTADDKTNRMHNNFNIDNRSSVYYNFGDNQKVVDFNQLDMSVDSLERSFRSRGQTTNLQTSHIFDRSLNNSMIFGNESVIDLNSLLNQSLVVEDSFDPKMINKQLRGSVLV